MFQSDKMQALTREHWRSMLREEVLSKFGFSGQQHGAILPMGDELINLHIQLKMFQQQINKKWETIQPNTANVKDYLVKASRNLRRLQIEDKAGKESKAPRLGVLI